jgi:3-hydroxyisobutyrate dehydrogenase-like beta-hydroxyacid dehydrogenase
MMRSIMMKGLEALALECVLSARKAGVEEEVLQSLEVTYPGFDWVNRSAHMLERVMTHGIRRAEEMREVAKTVDDLGLSNDMARAITKWHQRIGDMELEAEKGAGYQAHADLILQRIDKGSGDH